MFGSLCWKRLGELVVVAVVITASLVVTTIIEDVAGNVRGLGSDKDPNLTSGA